MALQAKFLKVGKGGTLAIYEVRGTSTELASYVANNFKDSEPVFKSTVDKKLILSNGNKVPLYFTAYPLPGKNMWHPMYQVQAGDKAGSWTLDKSELQFDALVAKSLGADLGQAIANESAKRYADSTPVSSSASSLLDEEDDSEEDFTADASEEANLETVETTAPKAAKTNK